MTHEKEYEHEHEHEHERKHNSTKAKERYMKIHSQHTLLRKITSKYNTHHRKGKVYYNYSIRLPRSWIEGLDLKPHDSLEWSIVSYDDPVILQLKKIKSEDDIN